MKTSGFLVLLLVFSLSGFLAPSARGADEVGDVFSDITFLAGLGDRSTGSPGCDAAADYILESFREAGLEEVNVQEFLHPVPEVLSAAVQVGDTSVRLHPWGPNVVYLSMTPDEGLSGPLVYVGDGSPDRFDGKPVRGSIVLMDMASGGNWMYAAMFEAKALIFLGNERSVRGDFEEKNTPTPLAFPRFWVPPEEGQRLKALALQDGASPVQATVHSKTRWRNKPVRNVYGLIPGKSEALKEEVVVLEAFYDASSNVLGIAPGADEAVSVAMLLNLARTLAKDPPERSMLLVATVGNGQALAGMREFIWASTEKRKSLKELQRNLDSRKDAVDRQLELLEGGVDVFSLENPEDSALVWEVVSRRARDRVDLLTRETQYRKALARREESIRDREPASVPAAPDASTSDTAMAGEDPRPYRKLSWRAGLGELTPEERVLSMDLLREAVPDLMVERDELKLRRRALRSSMRLRSLMSQNRSILFLSLHFSGNAPNIGLMEFGETYPLREDVRRQLRSSRLARMLNDIGEEVARETGLPNLVRSTSRFSQVGGDVGTSPNIRCLACDVAALASCSSVSLTTLDDDRSLWSTPYDTPDRLNVVQIERLARFVPELVRKLCCHSALEDSCQGGLQGLASLEGRALFLRQGELFPDQPAPGVIVSVMLGNNIFRTMAYRDGSFFLPGLSNSRVAFQKLILEPYGVDPVTGRVCATPDKVQTGKENYRIKVKGRVASTTLTMFHCEQTDVVGTIQPQKMGYLTKVDLLDAMTEATPVRYWYSRIDGRDTMSISVFLEKGTSFKLVLSETLLQKEFLLLNSSAENPAGVGFLIGNPASVPLVPYQAAADMSRLLGRRLENLQRRGIANQYLEALYETSAQELDEARLGLERNEYSRFWKNVSEAWAKLVVVYVEVEKTQRDVLGGVMFFVALFVPFAFVLERFLFCFRNIYQQIVAFLLILLMTIFTIRALHPAFQLTYSPMVVIIAFFIVGLSVLVSWIIFVRFEREMSDVQSEALHGVALQAQASKWQAFGAGFTIGASNLNRRRLRTALTCATLIILTFTVMSFTNVKSLHKTTDTRLSYDAPYRGVLLRDQFWRPLTPLTLEDMETRFAADGDATVWPRGWIEAASPSDRLLARIYADGSPSGATGKDGAGGVGAGVRSETLRAVGVEGVLGLGAGPPEYFQKILTHGRWLSPGPANEILLPVYLAQNLGLDPEKDLDATVTLWGDPYRVVGYFDGSLLESLKDLDQNPVTPAYLELMQGEELTEMEVEAMQSGEELLPMTERFRYANAWATVIVPFETCLAHGGKLKAVSILPGARSSMEVAEELSRWLSFPLFVGDNGGAWFHSAGTALRYQGVANILVPILIVVFICLNTMIGHVQERQKEISIYTSVGLAPTHVGFLFIVEAMSLAVLSTVIGYILAQLSAKFLGNTAAFSQLTFNYSSLASVACMFLVFSVVFVAALYPARLAARMAMPDVNRTWTLPPPVGDVITLNLPFLLKEEEERGIMGYLASFLMAHEDCSQGRFTADQTQLDIDSPVLEPHRLPDLVCLLIRSDIWLAPFDFGIKQRVQFHCCPSEDNPGYLEIGIRMTRLSGERSAWERANKDFIKVLRKQMLLWRLMGSEAKARYTDLAIEGFGR